MFIAEVIDDGMAYGKDVASRLKSVASIFSGGGVLPIGAIEWRTGGDPSLPAVTGIAAPLLPYLGQIPLIGEYVLCFEAPGTDNNDSSAAQSYYYLGPIQIDGSKNYNETQGIFKRTTGVNKTIPKPLVPTFAKKNVPALQPLFGDTIIQDRNGSAIRMSSTQIATSLKYMDGTVSGQMPFKPTGTPRISKKGSLFIPQAAGNPIMMLTVGMPGQASKSLKKLAGSLGTPTTLIENTDGDQSLIYLTSDQQLVYRPSRLFKHDPKKQPNTDDINAGGILDKGKNSAPHGGGVTSIKNYKTRTKDDTQNPHFSRGRFAQANAYPIGEARSQILLRSHRITLDAQLDSILMVALRDVKIGTKHWRIEMDSMMCLMEETIKQVAMIAQSVADLANGLNETVKVNQEVQYPTGVGPTGPCLNVYNDKYKKIEKAIGSTNDDAGTSLGNITKRIEAVDIILKEFITMRRSKSDAK